ncbi:dispersed gene family protein 1 (DGF-1), putative, partial [Trypanosoma cruzi]
SARVVASGGAVLRVSGSQVYAAHGLVFDSGVEANASAVVVNDNAGALTDGALLELRGSASFVSGSWLSVCGNSISGRLLSVPSYPRSADLVQSTLTLYGNAGSGPVVMDGTVALVGAGRKFVVGCLTLNGQALQPMDYRSAGIIGEFRAVACGVCDADVFCFAAATRAMSGSCSCRCAEGGYGRDCLPVYLPHVDGCNRTPEKPLMSHTATLTETHSLTSTWTPSLSTTQYGPTETLQVTETVALSPTRAPDGVGEQHAVVERRGVPDARRDDDGGWRRPDAERNPRRWERRPDAADGGAAAAVSMGKRSAAWHAPELRACVDGAAA